MKPGEKEDLIRRLRIYYNQHMSGIDRRKEMLAIIVLLEHSGMKISKPAQTGQDYEVENSEKSCIIVNDDFSESDHPRDENGQFIEGGGTNSNAQAHSVANKRKLKENFPKEIEGVSVPTTLNIKDKSFGKKVGKHAVDFYLDPSRSKDREKFRQIVKDVFDNAEEVRKVDWRGYKDAFAFIKGKNVVIMNSNNDFVTILKGGIENVRVKNGRKQ